MRESTGVAIQAKILAKCCKLKGTRFREGTNSFARTKEPARVSLSLAERTLSRAGRSAISTSIKYCVSSYIRDSRDVKNLNSSTSIFRKALSFSRICLNSDQSHPISL